MLVTVAVTGRRSPARLICVNTEVETDLRGRPEVEADVRRGDGRRQLLQVARCREARRRHDADRRCPGVGRVELRALERMALVEDHRAIHDRAYGGVRTDDAHAHRRRKPSAQRLCRCHIERRRIQPHRLHAHGAVRRESCRRDIARAHREGEARGMDRDGQRGVVVARRSRRDRRRAQAAALDIDRADPSAGQRRRHVSERHGRRAHRSGIGGHRGDRAAVARRRHIQLAGRRGTQREGHERLELETDLHGRRVELNVGSRDGRTDLTERRRRRVAGRRHHAHRRRAACCGIEEEAFQRIASVKGQAADAHVVDVDDRSDIGI